MLFIDCVADKGVIEPERIASQSNTPSGQMAIPWKLYLPCWFLGAAVQSAVFFSFNAVDYFNFFFPDDFKPEVYIGVVVGVGASLGAVITVSFPPRKGLLTVLVVTLIVSAVVLVVEVVVTPLTDLIEDRARFSILLTLIFVATVVQNVGGGALYNFVGKHFPKFGVHAAQSGGVCAFAATFVVRCISKGSFEYEKDPNHGFRLSGYLFVALVDLIIVVACCLIVVLRRFEREGKKNLNESGEVRPLLQSSKQTLKLSRRQIIKNNWAALTTICMTLVISNALFPGITSQFHGNYNCSSSSLHSNHSHPASNENTVSSPNPPVTSDKTGWFVVVLFGCYSVADAIGKNLPIFGILYNKTTIVLNLLFQLIIAVPVLLIYFEPCVQQLQADWLAYLTVGILGLINGYGLCAAMMLLAPGHRGKKQEEGMATSIGYMFLQVGILLGMGVSVFLVDYVFVKTKT